MSSVRRVGIARVVLTAALAVVGLAVVPGTVPAAAAGTVRTHRLSAGVTLSVRDFHLGKRPEHATLLSIDLRNRHLRVDAVTPGNVLGAPRQALSTMVTRNRALVGINTAFFDMAARNAAPRDGVIRSGRVVKTTRRHWDANLFVTRSGRARVGAVAFTGRLTRAVRGRTKAAATSLYGVNSIGDLQRGRLVLITPALMAPVFARRCGVALGQRHGTKRIIVRTHRSVTRTRRLHAGEFALVACGGASAWLRAQVRPHDRVSIATAVRGGTPRTLVSGGRELVRNGRTFHDAGGKVFPGNPRNPETFACASRTGRHLLLGTVDGRQKTSSGVTFDELTRYLLSLHCWSGLVFDGGGSTTIVGRSSLRVPVTVLNHPSGGVQRKFPAGLVVSRR